MGSLAVGCWGLMGLGPGGPGGCCLTALKEEKVSVFWGPILVQIVQYLAALLLCTLVSGQDWTCDECAEDGAALGAFASSKTAIASQVDVLLAELCPQAEDPEFCAENLPGFWAQLSPIIFPGHFSYICDDLEECSPPEKVNIL